MKTIILHHVLYKKKLIAIGLFMFCYIGILIAIALTNDTALGRLLYPDGALHDYDIVSKQIMRFVGSAVLAIIAFDFDSTYDLPLYAYFSKSKVLIAKLAVHLGLVLLLAAVLIIIRIGIGFSVYQRISREMIMTATWMGFDLFILFFWMLLLTPYKFKQASFLMVACYLLITLLAEDLKKMTIYYIFPFYHTIYSTFQLSNIYVIVYCLCMLFLVYLKVLNTEC